MKKIYLFGNGGHALSCIDAIERQKKFKIKGIFYKKNNYKKNILNYPLIKENDKNIKKILGKKYGLVCIGQIKTSKFRKKIFNKMKKEGFSPAKVISPRSTIYKNTEIGEGTIVMNGVVINPNVKIGKSLLKCVHPMKSNEAINHRLLFQ